MEDGVPIGLSLLQLEQLQDLMYLKSNRVDGLRSLQQNIIRLEHPRWEVEHHLLEVLEV